jgi:tetratricopeptide (TPR) repeat protein
MAHLRRALAARAGSPAYLEALISFHQHRFAEASQRAHAAFVESPMLYEAGALEARAHSEAGRQLLAADKLGEATAEFATARRTFQRVLEIGRSDDEAWLAYGEMVFVQANALAHGELVPDLKQEAVTALHNVQRINPENGKAFLREAQIELAQGNSDLVWYRDPGGYVDKALALAKDARAHDADPAEVDAHVCVAYWERAAYQGTHGVDPHAAFEQAIAACERAAAARPDADNHANLGVLYTTLASYEGEHGNDPEHLFERAERNLRTAIGIDDDAGTHYNLAWLWTRVAQYQESHGQSPQRAVDHALAESEATIRLTKTRSDVWAGMSYALVVRARAQRAQHEDAEPTLARAHAALERAFALDANFTAAIKARIMISALDAEALLERNTDPTPVVAAMRADARLLVSRLPEDGAAHRLWSQAELLGARWAVAHRRGAEPLLTRAAAEAARARDDNAMDALAWTASAEVEHVRIEAARARGVAPSAAVVASGLAFIERAMTIDPRLARTLTLRDALVRQAHLLSVPVPIR